MTVPIKFVVVDYRSGTDDFTLDEYINGEKTRVLKMKAADMARTLHVPEAIDDPHSLIGEEFGISGAHFRQQKTH